MMYIEYIGLGHLHFFDLYKIQPFVAFPGSTGPSWLVHSVNQIFCLTLIFSGRGPGAGAVLL